MKTIMKLYAYLPVLLLLCILSCKKDDIIPSPGPPNDEPNNVVNKVPVARAGLDVTLILPDDSVTLNGRKSYDPDGLISKFYWERIAGPGTTIIRNPDSAVTVITGLVKGEYTFQLTVTDGAGAVGKDMTVVKVIGPAECTTAGLPQVEAALTEVGNLSIAQNPRVAVCGDKIFYAGGVHGYGGVDIYDVSEKRWYYQELSQARANIAMTSCGTKVFFAGGNYYESYYDIVDIYDVATGSWSVEHLSEPKSSATAAAMGDKVFFAGGVTEFGLGQTAVIDIYDINTKTWTQASLSEAKVGVGAVVANNKLYFAGGFNYLSWGIPDPYYQTVDIFDASTGNWTRSELRTITGDVTGTVYNNKIYWSGMTPSGLDSKVEVWDTQTGYVTSYCLSYPRTMPGVAVKNNDMVFFTSNSGMPDVPVSNRFDIINPETGSITLGKMNIGFKGSAIVSVNNEIYIAGGTITNLSEEVNKRTGLSAKVFKLNWTVNTR